MRARIAGTSLARILIVDDEAAQMKALCDTLRDEGYETVGFTRGKPALAALRQTEFDLLLADLMMPEMDGIALLQAAREVDPDLVGIIMTGEGSIASAVEAMKSGALDYILKPFKLSVILPVLSRALAVQRLRMENADLERRLRERAAELEVANKELESFSYSVSHDLRVPLRAIGGFSNALTRNHSAHLPAEAQRLLSSVVRNAVRMEHLIEDLLRFSHLVRQPLSKRSVNVSDLVHQVVEELRNEESNRQIEIRIAALPNCIADSALLSQVFVNLLSNAFKYTRKNEQSIVEVGCRSEDQQHIFFVRDNGAGFDMQYAEKLFGVFQRLHKAEEFEGTGVGLSIVQRVIQRHGGRVWAEAEVDKGATFYFSLPA
jgi:signal transduction histidine kinase